MKKFKAEIWSKDENKRLFGVDIVEAKDNADAEKKLRKLYKKSFDLSIMKTGQNYLKLIELQE